MKHRCNEIGSGSFLKAHPQVYKNWELFQQCGIFRFSFLLIINATLQISIICVINRLL
jgi:hypothetical protein